MKQEIRLYEITAMVSVSTVIAATSKEDAMKHIETWEDAWFDRSNADRLCVSDIDLFDVRKPYSVHTVEGDAHAITDAARKLLEQKARKQGN